MTGQPPLYPAHAQPEQILELAERLLKAGYSLSDAYGLLGGNYLRVLSHHDGTVPGL